MQDTVISDSLRLPLARGRVPTTGNTADQGADIRRIVVWGTGACARNFIANLRPGVDVIAHTDRNRDKWGTELDGRPVVAPSTLGDLSYDMLVLASAAAPEIRPTLRYLELPHAAAEIVNFTGPQDGWRRQDLFARPLFANLQIGITTRCNLLCKHCPRDLDESVYSDLELNQFRKYLTAFDPSQFHRLLVSDFGEVTMLRNFLAYLRAARELGWQRIEFVTNATNGKRELWEAIFSETLARYIVISLEGTGEMFEAVRGFPWKRFVANVATISELNSRYGRPAELILNAVCMRSNLHNLPDIVDFAAASGASLFFVHLNPSNQFNNPLGKHDNHLDLAPRADVVDVFREVTKRAKQLAVTVHLPETFPELEPAMPAMRVVDTVMPAPQDAAPKDLLCVQPLRFVEVDDKGNVYPCCQMAKRHAVGNLERNTFDEIWTGPQYRQLLDGLRPGGDPIQVCKECNMYRGKNF